MNYIERLKISIEGNQQTKFETFDNFFVATGYERIVIGGRGPYVEFNSTQINLDSFIISDEEYWRINSDLAYYVEYRTSSISNVKVYFQKKLVDYADYKIGLYYISPFDLLADGFKIIEKLKKGKK